MFISNILSLYVVEFRYIIHQNKDCLWGNDIHFLSAPQNYDECDKWCINNRTCGAYKAIMTKYPNTCFFKNKSCKNNLFRNAKREAYIPQGTEVKKMIPLKTVKNI